MTVERRELHALDIYNVVITRAQRYIAHVMTSSVPVPLVQLLGTLFVFKASTASRKEAVTDCKKQSRAGFNAAYKAQ